MTPHEIDTLERQWRNQWIEDAGQCVVEYLRELTDSGATIDDIDQLLAQDNDQICAVINRRADELRTLIVADHYGLETECRGR